MVHHEAGDAGEGLEQHQREHGHAQLEVVQVVVQGPVLGDCHDEGRQHHGHACNALSLVAFTALLHLGWLGGALHGGCGAMHGSCSAMQDPALVLALWLSEGGFLGANCWGCSIGGSSACSVLMGLLTCNLEGDVHHEPLAEGVLHAQQVRTGPQGEASRCKTGWSSRARQQRSPAPLNAASEAVAPPQQEAV